MSKITFEDFNFAILEVEKTFKYHESLNTFFRKNSVDGYIYQPDCITSTLRLLHLIFNEEDKEEWISYFCFDLDFGKKWKPGTITAKDGTDIKLENIEDLYNLLCDNKLE